MKYSCLYHPPLLPSHQGRGKNGNPVRERSKKEVPSMDLRTLTEKQTLLPPLPLWERVRVRGILR